MTRKKKTFVSLFKGDLDYFKAYMQALQIKVESVLHCLHLPEVTAQDTRGKKKDNKKNKQTKKERRYNQVTYALKHTENRAAQHSTAQK